MKIPIPKSEVLRLLPIVPGQYRAQITAGSIRESRGGGFHISWEFTISEGEYTGRKLWMNMSLKETALWKVVRFAECCGYDLQKIAKTGSVDHESLIGAKLLVTVDEDPMYGMQVTDFAKLA